MNTLRAAIYYAVGAVTAGVVCLLLVLAFPLPFRARYRIGLVTFSDTARVAAPHWSS